MIASLSGTLAHKGLDRVVVDVQGVGYLVFVSLQTLGDLPAEGNPVSLLCHTHVREEALQLFGFSQQREREVFESLTSVSGVGPKLAVTILSGMPVSDLVAAIASADHKRLQKIPGVGKKTAERLVVELKERFAEMGTREAAAETGGHAFDHLVDALVGLGYKRAQAERSVERVSKGSTTARPEELLRRALASMQEL